MAYPIPNSRDLAELEILELQQQLQTLERKLKTVTVENSELASLGKAKCAYERKASIFFLVEPSEFRKRKQMELRDLKSERDSLVNLIKAQKAKLGID